MKIRTSTSTRPHQEMLPNNSSKNKTKVLTQSYLQTLRLIKTPVYSVSHGSLLFYLIKSHTPLSKLPSVLQGSNRQDRKRHKIRKTASVMSQALLLHVLSFHDSGPLIHHCGLWSMVSATQTYSVLTLFIYTQLCNRRRLPRVQPSIHAEVQVLL